MANFMYFAGVLLLLSVFNIEGNAQIEISSTMATDCDPEINCDGSGQCVTGTNGTWSCKCNYSYTTHPEPDMPLSTDTVYCNYHQKKQFNAFFLSFFCGYFAVGRFYVGSMLMAGLKIGYIVGIPFCLCCGLCLASLCGSECAETIQCPGNGKVTWCGLNCIPAILWFLCFAVVWWVVDWALFIANVIPDGNDVELAPW